MDRAAKEQREICSLDNSAEEVGLHRIDHHARLNGTDGSRHRDWRTVVLKHVFQSLDESEGGIRSCIRDVLLDKVDLGESVHHYDVRHTSPSQVSCQNASKGEADATSNGCEKDLNPLAITKLCQDTFSEIISSENFASLCKLLLENFQGIKDESLFDFSPINSRMKEGAYENSPLLFSSDIQQVWRKLHAIGSEIVSLTKCLSDLSKTSYCEQFVTCPFRWEAYCMENLKENTRNLIGSTNQRNERHVVFISLPVVIIVENNQWGRIVLFVIYVKIYTIYHALIHLSKMFP